MRCIQKHDYLFWKKFGKYDIYICQRCEKINVNTTERAD